MSPDIPDADTPSPDSPLRVLCTCGYTRRYESLSDFQSDGGEITYHQTQDLYAAYCPSCETPRPVQTGVFDWDDIGQEFCFALGEFEAGYNPLEASLSTEYDPTRATFDDVVNPLTIARQRFDAICAVCGERLTESEFYENGEEPEIGWQYYRCSACGNTMHPDSVGHLGTDNES